MKRWFPLALVCLGLILFALAHYLGNEAGTEEIIGRIAGMMMFFGSVVCVGCGLLTFFLRDNDEVW